MVISRACSGSARPGLDLDVLMSALKGDDRLRAELLLTEAQSLARQMVLSATPGDQQWARDLARTLCSANSPHAPALCVDILILLAEWLDYDADGPYALQLLEHALQITIAAGTVAAQRRVLNVLGAVHQRQKNVAEANVCLVKALDLAEKIGDRLGRCAVLSNLAALRLNMGMLDDSIKLSNLVIELCGNEPLFDQVRTQSHQNLAESYLLLSDLQLAKHHIALAITQSPRTSATSYLTRRVMLELTYAKVLARLNEFEDMQLHVQAAGRIAMEAGSHTALTQYELALALSEAARGDSDLAATRLAKLRQKLKPNDISFRDLIEIELQAVRMAGKEEYLDYYNRKYLFSLSEYQRKNAIEQFAAIKARIRVWLETGDKYRKSSNQITDADGLRRFFDEMTPLAMLAALREDATGEHSYRVGRLSRMLAVHVGYSEKHAAVIENAGRLHDIGKLATPDAVLIKRGSLSTAELEVVRRHPTEGCQMLADVLYAVQGAERRVPHGICEYIRVAAEVAHCHHEWWDGSGYPRGLLGEAIPDAARIVALADVFDELTHERPYKDRFSKSASTRQIKALRGRQFEPRLCDAFVDLVETLPEQEDEALSESLPFAAANRVIARLAAQVLVEPTGIR